MKNFILIFALVFLQLSVGAQTYNPPSNSVPAVILGWTANPDPSVGSYNLYEGATLGSNYTQKINLPGSTSSYTFTNLVRGSKCYFNISSVSTNGIEGALAGDISYTVPVGPAPPLFKPLSVLVAQSSPTFLNPAWTDLAVLSAFPQTTSFYRLKITPAK